MFKEKFIDLCNKRGESPTFVCKKLGLSNAAFSSWNENTIPRKTTLKKIADYFNVETDYLLGNKNDHNTEKGTLSEQEKTLLESFRSTTELGRQRIIQAVLNICDEIEKKDQSADTSSAG